MGPLAFGSSDSRAPMMAPLIGEDRKWPSGRRRVKTTRLTQLRHWPQPVFIPYDMSEEADYRRLCEMKRRRGA